MRNDESASGGSLLAKALWYAHAGHAVFPVRARGKTPLTTHGFKEATTDCETIKSWWRRWPTANIGLAVPGGLLVLDVDSEQALHSLKAQDLELPSTSTARTSRGWHLWFEVPQPVKNCVGILPGVDVRASGGYVIVPPSVHPSGSVYRWEVPLDWDSITECPEWLLSRLTEQGGQRQGRRPEDWQQVISKPVARGRRNQTLAEVAGLLFRCLPAAVAAEFAYCWAQVRLRPALPQAEVERTIDSIAGRELRRQRGSA